jgi:hypothetical protein
MAPLTKVLAKFRGVLAAAQPLQEIFSLGLGELPIRDRGVKRRASVTSAHIAQDGLERLGGISFSELLGLTWSDAPAGDHGVELPRYPLRFCLASRRAQCCP